MSVKIAYAGDRDISVKVLEYILQQEVEPLALFISSKKMASHDENLIKLCDHLDDSKILRASEFKKEENISKIEKLDLDYIISVHFPYIYPKSVLEIPEHGVVNLHPAYLPYNRGWHTPTWAIHDTTPYGATLHFMEEEIDSGDIIHQKKLEKKLSDTADDLYQRVKKLEFQVFKEGWKDLVNFDYDRKSQNLEKGSKHTKEDIKKIQKIDLNEKIKAEKLIRKLKALTTNKISEAAYFENEGKKYRVQINIEKEDE